MSFNFESLQISNEEIKKITGCNFLLYEKNKVIRKNKLSLKIIKDNSKLKRFANSFILSFHANNWFVQLFFFYLFYSILGTPIYSLVLFIFKIEPDSTIMSSLVLMYWLLYPVMAYLVIKILPQRTIESINNMSPTPLGILLDEVDKFNKAAKQMDVVNQLESVGNKGVFKDKDKVIAALSSVRDDLIRALKTERILRENPEFNAAQLSVDLTALRALDVGEQTGEYRQIVSDVWEIALSVQEEMEKLQHFKS